MSNPAFVASVSTRLLRQHLAKVPVGSIITYSALGAIISEPVSGAHPALQSARDSLLRQQNMVFGVVRGEGLKRLSDSEIVAASDGDLDTLRRRARKGVRKLTSVQDFAALSPKDQLGHTTKLSILTATAALTSDKGIKKVEAAATGRATELPISDTLKAFLVSP